MTANEAKEMICQLFLSGDMSFPIDEDTQILEEGICDSLGLVQIASALEDRVDGISITNQEITPKNFGSINAIVQFVARKTAVS